MQERKEKTAFCSYFKMKPPEFYGLNKGKIGKSWMKWLELAQKLDKVFEVAILTKR